jgi:hypothetical protein
MSMNDIGIEFPYHGTQMSHCEQVGFARESDPSRTPWLSVLGICRNDYQVLYIPLLKPVREIEELVLSPPPHSCRRDVKNFHPFR